jgi:hypothetical protein
VQGLICGLALSTLTIQNSAANARRVAAYLGGSDLLPARAISESTGYRSATSVCETRRMRIQDDVDNVVQRTLLLAFVHRDQFRDPANFKSWLCSIAVNDIRMILRSTKVCVSLTVCPEVGAAETIDSPLTRLQERERLAPILFT